jgi:exopolysaccharide biosynthesis WecB/TagA/CpsF family protein
MSSVEILNVDIDNIRLCDLLQTLGETGGVVFTPNVDHVMRLQKDPEFYAIYQHADFRVCDSQVLLYASKILRKPIKEKISGSDLFPAFCQYYRDDESIKVFLLGARPGVATQAQKNINERVGREIVVAAHSPSFGFETDPQECQEIIDLINQSGANVLAIGVGAPKQEKWIVEHKTQLTTIKTFLAIGATIDFEAGHVKRAPKWVSEVGLEWLYRLLSEPKRLWKRYIIDDSLFLPLLLKQCLGLYQNPFCQVCSELENYQSFSSAQITPCSSKGSPDWEDHAPSFQKVGFGFISRFSR